MFNKNNLAQGLPVNIVVTVIIGLVIFGLGIGLFANISSSGESTVEDLQENIKTEIASLECEGEDWICTPSYKVSIGDSETFDIYISNRDDNDNSYKIVIETESIGDGNQAIVSDSNGAVIINYPPNDIAVSSGYSASIPFSATTSRVNKPGSFFTTVILQNDAGVEIDRTPLIIQVE